MSSILMLGRQHMALHPSEIQGIPGLFEVLQKAPELAGKGERFADPFFYALGAEIVDSLDASDYESCSKVHDLNLPIPEAWHAQYDVVFDGGTLEHVFHFPNAIANAMNLVAEGGHFVNCSPSNNYNGHGFYQFSPELFFRLFEKARGYRIILMALAESRPGGRIYSLTDPAELGFRTNFQGKGMLQLVMVAKREVVMPIEMRDSPYQSDYSKTWATTGSENPVDGANHGRAPGRRRPIKRVIRSVIPDALLYRYDQFRTHRRRKRESRRGLAQVKNLESCLR